MDMGQGMSGKMCGCPHHKVGAGAVTLIGLLFLLNAMGSLDAASLSYAWPVLLMVAGLTKMFGGGCKCCSMHRM